MNSTTHIIFFSVPALRPKDISKETTPTLHGWAVSGGMAALIPNFPAVTSPVQATMFTGLSPREHGVIANGFYFRDRDEVEFWMGCGDVVQGSKTWDLLRTRHPRFTSAVWHAQNIKDASADFIVTPAPIHEPDGTTKLWCYSKPDGLYRDLLQELGHFPLQHYWGPLSNIESTRWILRAALRLIRSAAPNFNWLYLPHLDYAAQKFGPDSVEATSSLRELDRELAEFVEGVEQTSIAENVVYLVAGEYAMTAVSRAVFPNRFLREAGLLDVRNENGSEGIDLKHSRAFAMVDHQFAHVYVRDSDSRNVHRAVGVLGNVPGVADVLAGTERAKLGLDHPRCGDIIILAEEDAWFAYYWWFDDAKAPPFTRTVDIHRKPGYDPVELFFDPGTRGIPLRPELVKGSHGLPANVSSRHTVFVTSRAIGSWSPDLPIRAEQIQRITLDYF